MVLKEDSKQRLGNTGQFIFSDRMLRLIYFIYLRYYHDKKYGLPFSHLAHEAKITLSHAIKLAKLLIDDGYCIKKSYDKRSYYIEFTDKGLNIGKKVHELYNMMI